MKDVDDSATTPVVESGAQEARFAKSAPLATDPASSEKLYRRHIARYYARSAKKFDDIHDSMFPDLPGLPAAAASPFLNGVRNEEIWQWLNRDFCKTKLDYFLSLCS